MNSENNNGQVEIEEIQKRIDYLISTDRISDSEKVAIARNALKILEQTEKKEAV